MEKRLIAVRSDDNVKDYAELTLPLIEDYAQKCEADFLQIQDCKGLHPHYRIMQFYELFDEYDRILSMDSDVIIRSFCPNIFNEISFDTIATVLEDKGSRQEDRRQRLKLVQEKFGDVGLKEGYINTGFALFSKDHKDLFKERDENNLWMSYGYDDVYLRYMIEKLNLKIQELPYQFNHMSMFSEEWNGFQSRFNSFVIHYAGQGFSNIVKRDDQIKQDYLLLKKYDLL